MRIGSAGLAGSRVTPPLPFSLGDQASFAYIFFFCGCLCTPLLLSGYVYEYYSVTWNWSCILIAAMKGFRVNSNVFPRNGRFCFCCAFGGCLSPSPSSSLARSLGWLTDCLFCVWRVPVSPPLLLRSLARSTDWLLVFCL